MEYQARNMHQRGSQTQMWVALLSGDQQAAGDALAGCSLWSVSHDHNGATFVHRSYNLVKHGVIKHRQGICIKKGFKHRRSPEWGSEADLRCIRRMQALVTQCVAIRSLKPQAASVVYCRYTYRICMVGSSTCIMIW